MDRTNISIAGPAIRSELKLDDVHLGWVFSAFLVGYAAFQVVGGWLAYRFGPRLVLAAGDWMRNLSRHRRAVLVALDCLHRHLRERRRRASAVPVLHRHRHLLALGTR